MEMKINVHSLIDVITNSSTSIFITMHGKSVDEMYELLNEVLKIADSDKKAEDLFDIEIDRDWDSIVEKFIENEDFTEDEEKLVEEYEAFEDYKKARVFVMEKIVPCLKESGRWEDFNTNYYEMEENSWLVVKAKDNTKSTMDLWKKIRNLFNVDAIRDG